jgi:plasmid maintenance system antidote protein VapI
MKSLRNPKQKPTQTELARRLDVSRLSVSELLLDIAIRVGCLTSTTPESWLRMQEALGLWPLEQDPRRYRQIEPIAA